MKFPQVWQQMLIGSIIRTLIWPSAGRFPRGTFAGVEVGRDVFVEDFTFAHFLCVFICVVVVYVVRMKNA